MLTLERAYDVKNVNANVNFKIETSVSFSAETENFRF